MAGSTFSSLAFTMVMELIIGHPIVWIGEERLQGGLHFTPTTAICGQYCMNN